MKILPVLPKENSNNHNKIILLFIWYALYIWKCLIVLKLITIISSSVKILLNFFYFFDFKF